MRGICNQLMSTPQIEYLALTEIVYHFGSVLIEAYPLELFNKAGSRASSRAALEEMGIVPRLIPAESLDSLLAMECFESVWDWPLKHFGIRTACVVCDLIPFRINELRNDASKAEYFKALGSVVERADVLLCISHATANDLKTIFPEAAAKTGVISLGCGRSVTQHELAAEKLAPKGFAPLSDTATILMVGTVENRKNFQSVLAAAPLIAAAVSPRKLRIVVVGDVVGPGDIFRTVYHQILQRAQEVATIVFSGYIKETELVDYYRSSSVFIFPSFWEGFGFPILEAMLFGIPVVASDIPCHREVGGEHVRYCDPYDVEDIAARATEAIGLPPKRRAWEGARARAWANGFVWNRTAEECQHVLSSLAGDAEAGTIVQLLQSPVRRLLPPPAAGTYAAGETGFLVSLRDVVEQQDLRHFVLMSLLQDHAAAEESGIVLVLAVERDSLELVSAGYLLTRVQELLDAAGRWTLKVIVFGELVDFTLRQVEIVTLIDDLALDTYQEQELTASDIMALQNRDRRVHVGMIHATTPEALAQAAETLTYDRAVVVDAPSGAQEALASDRIRTLVARALPDPASLVHRFETEVYTRGGVAAALGWLESVSTGAAADTCARSLLATSPSLEETIRAVVLVGTVTDYQEAKRVVAGLTGQRRPAGIIVALVGEEGLAGRHPGVLTFQNPDSLRILILAAATVIGRTNGGQLTDELRFAASIGKRVIVVGAANPFLSRLFAVEAWANLSESIEAGTRVEAREGDVYPKGMAVVLAAMHAIGSGRRLIGVDPVSLRYLLGQSDVLAFGTRLQRAGVDGGSWSQLLTYVDTLPPAAPPPARPILDEVMPAKSKSRLGRTANRLMGKQQSSPWPQVALADKARDAKNWPVAARHYEKALALDPSLAAIWVQHGHAVKEQGQLVEAEVSYNRSLSLAPSLPDTHLQMGHLLKLMERLQDAAAAYFQAIALDPHSEASRELVGLGYSAHAIELGMIARQKRDA